MHSYRGCCHDSRPVMLGFKVMSLVWGHNGEGRNGIYFPAFAVMRAQAESASASRRTVRRSREPSRCAPSGPGRPALGGPACRHGGHRLRVRDLAGLALHHQVELTDSDAQGTTRVAGEILPLARAVAGLEPEGAVGPVPESGPPPGGLRSGSSPSAAPRRGHRGSPSSAGTPYGIPRCRSTARHPSQSRALSWPSG